MPKQEIQVQAEVKVETPIEIELEALSNICLEVERLDKDARGRAMKYILDRFGIYIPSSY